MKIWMIAWKDVTIRLRDRRTILTLLLMPLLLTLILGAALGGVFSDGGLPEMTVAVSNQDDGEISKGLVDGVFKSEGLASKITLESYNTAEEVRAAVADGRATAGVILPAHFSGDVSAGMQTQAEVVQDPAKPTSGQVIKSIVTSYMQRVSGVAGAVQQVMTDLGQRAVATGHIPPAELGSIAEALAQELRQAAEAPVIGVEDRPVGDRAISAQQYYAAAMAVMFLLFNATLGAKSILDERDNETLGRMLSSPTSKTSVLLGKFVGNLLFAVLQFLLLAAATRFLFGIDWGDDAGQLLAIGFVYAVAVSGLAMTVAATVKETKTADMLTGIAVQILSVLGGSMIPVAQFPDLLQKISLAVPNAWALNGLIDIMTGTTWQALLLPITVLLGIGAAALAVGTWRLAAR